MKKFLSWLTSPLRQFRAPEQEPSRAPVGASRSSASSLRRPANELERLLVLAATDPSERVGFQQALLKSDLYVATPDTPRVPGWHTLESSENVNMLTVAGPDGKPIPALFTSETGLADAFGAGTAYLKINGEALLGLVEKDGAVLNPGQPYGVHWTSQDLAAMLGRPVSRVIEKNTQIMLGTPAEHPEKLVAALVASLGQDSRIQSAWLALAVWPESQEWTWHLDIRSGASREELGDTISDALRRAGDIGRPVDVVVNPQGGDDGAGIRIKPSQTH